MIKHTDEVNSDIKARKCALDISNSFIMQAPAGSGKTELLIQRYLKLLSVASQPEEIIAITFTNKAANEIKQRIISILKDAKEGVRPSEEYKITTIGFAIKVLKRSEQLNWNLIISNQRIRILTIDGLCSEITNKSPLAGSYRRRIVDDFELNNVYRQASISAINTLSDLDKYRADSIRVLSHLDGDIEKYISLMSHMLELRDQWIEIIGSGVKVNQKDLNHLKTILEENISNVVNNHLNALSEIFPDKEFRSLEKAFDFLINNQESLFTNDQKISPIKRDTFNQNMWKATANLLTTNNGKWRKRISIKEGIPASQTTIKKTVIKALSCLEKNHQLRDLLHSVKKLPESKYDENQWEVLLSLMRLLPIAVAELKTLFNSRNISDYIEIADSALFSLSNDDGPTDLSLMMDYQIKHILLDEAQDTSRRQFNLIEKLVEGWDESDGRTLFLVGDPMQSIYRFRNARVSLFLSVVKDGIGNLRPKKLKLSENYRSEKLLVEKFNEVFTKVFPKKTHLLSGAVNYSKSTATKMNDNEGKFELHTLFDQDEKNESVYIKELIQKKLECTDNEIVILVRSRTHLFPILKELKSADIKVSAIEIDRLIDLPEMIEPIAITRALSNKFDRAAWIGLLRSPMIGLTWNDILALIKNTNDDIWSIINDSNNLMNLSITRRKIIIKFREIIRESFQTSNSRSLRDRVEEIWFQMGGLALIKSSNQLKNIRYYLDIIEEIESDSNMKDVSRIEDILDYYRVSNMSDNDTRVKVMTIHKAKGLEFDHVIIPFLARKPQHNDKTLINWIDYKTDKNDLIISPIATDGEDLLYNYINDYIKDANENETLRLIYVGFTRACKSLDIIGNVKLIEDNDNRVIKVPSKQSFLYKLWPAFNESFERNKNLNKPIQNQKKEEQYIKPVLKRIKSDYCIKEQYPWCDENLFSKQDLPISENDIEFSWATENAKHSGSIIHRWLHVFSLEKRIIPIAKIKHYKSINNKLIKSYFIDKEQIPDVIKRIDSTLSNVIQDKKNHWIFLGDGYSEIPLTGIYQGRVESIIIDRVNIDENGNHWVIDYKTGSHDGSDTEGFIENEIIRYKPQLEKYEYMYKVYSGQVPKLALYYPNLKQLIELK